MAMVYRVRRFEPISICIHKLVPDDVDLEKMWNKINGKTSYNEF